ncbi:MAG: radical SAM protein [Anaerolineae bacterium]
MSLGSAAVLGLVQAPVQVAPTTVYLMLGGRCTNDCAFCAQARSSDAGKDNLSRVTWPRFPVSLLLAALTERSGQFQRLCIQATGSPTAFADTLRLVPQLRRHTDLPIDASILPTTVEAAAELIAAGVDHIGFGVDAASAAVFAETKGGGIERYTKLVEAVAARFPGNAAVHLIAGLGESERELADALQRYHDLGAFAALFAFCPVPGTRMASRPAPLLASYRRLQVARYLIAHWLGRADGFRYDADGHIAGYGAAPLAALGDGEAFRTSGCPGCNRPFYNERPSGPMYNYARPLTADEATAALRETGIAALAAVPTGAVHA